MCFSTLKRLANKHGYSVRRGYQQYNHPGWGYVTTGSGERIVGYHIYDYSIGAVICGCNDLYDHALTLKEAERTIQRLIA